jgi:DNA-binding response OmpR family regulator
MQLLDDRGSRDMSGLIRRTKPLVLIVEDDPWIRSISCALLEEEGFAIATAADGKAGLRMAEQLRPVVIVLDLGLPQLSGDEFLRCIRARPSLWKTPVIVVSAQEPSEGIAMRADGFLRKPVDLTELMQRVWQAATAGVQHEHTICVPGS